MNFRAFKDNTISEDYKNQILAIDLHTNNTGKVSLKGIIEEIDAESKLLVFNDDRLKNEILIDNEKENPFSKTLYTKRNKESQIFPSGNMRFFCHLSILLMLK